MPSVLFLTDGYIHSIRASDSSVKQFENVTKHLTIGSVDPENVARYQAKLREWEDKLSISEKMVDNAQKTGRLKIDIQLFARKSSRALTISSRQSEKATPISLTKSKPDRGAETPTTAAETPNRAKPPRTMPIM